MVSLASVGDKFAIPFQIIEGGSGIVRGVITETDQTTGQVSVFASPRHFLRCNTPTALRPGVVIQSPAGGIYMVGTNGPSEHYTATIWTSFKLFQVTRQVLWERRRTRVDPITRLPREDGVENKGLIWAAIEPLDRMLFDKRLKDSIEQSRFIAASPVLIDDILDGEVVTRSDVQLGLHIGVIN